MEPMNVERKAEWKDGEVVLNKRVWKTEADDIYLVLNRFLLYYIKTKLNSMV
jgi:hypothetical protein